MRIAWLRAPRSGTALDVALAAALLAAAGTEYLAARDWQQPRAVDAILLAALLAPIAWRRRAPLAATCVAMSAAAALSLTVVYDMNLATPNAVVFVVPYSVAAHEPRRRAFAGLAVCLAAMAFGSLASRASGSSWVFAIGAPAASWACGRMLRARRELTARLAETLARLQREQADRTLLAVAHERTRISHDLEVVMTRSLTGMVLQSETALMLLDSDPAGADAAMAMIEDTGREALAEMRTVLGSLRTDGHARDLAPQPGVGELHALIDRARAEGRSVDLLVEGEPRPLLPSADLAVYRIVEDALAYTRAGGDPAVRVQIALRFGTGAVGLEVTTGTQSSPDWPTVGVRERVALCSGDLAVERLAGAGTRLRARLPTASGRALA